MQNRQTALQWGAGNRLELWMYDLLPIAAQLTP